MQAHTLCTSLDCYEKVKCESNCCVVVDFACEVCAVYCVEDWGVEDQGESALCHQLVKDDSLCDQWKVLRRC